MNTYYVYEHIRNDTGECFYIGKGTKYRYVSKDGRSKFWDNIVNKVGFHHNIIASNLTEKEALHFEVVMIEAVKKAGVKLCNLTNGGDGISGYRHTEKSKKRMSEVNCMKNPETVAKMSVSKRGKKASEETKKKMSIAHQNPSQGTRDKISAAHKTRSAEVALWAANDNPKNIKIEYLGEIYNSVSALARYLNMPQRTLNHRVTKNPKKYGYKVL